MALSRETNGCICNYSLMDLSRRMQIEDILETEM